MANEHTKVVGAPQDEGKKLRNHIMEFWLENLGTDELEAMIEELKVEVRMRK